MNKTFLTITMLSLSMLSANVLADKIVIKGDPVVVEKQGEMYVVPSSATVTTVSSDPYLFTVNDTKEVCYKEVQPALAKVDLGIMKFKMGNDSVSMHCYTYSPEYFVVP